MNNLHKIAIDKATELLSYVKTYEELLHYTKCHLNFISPFSNHVISDEIIERSTNHVWKNHILFSNIDDYEDC